VTRLRFPTAVHLPVLFPEEMKRSFCECFWDARRLLTDGLLLQRFHQRRLKKFYDWHGFASFLYLYTSFHAWSLQFCNVQSI